MSVMKLKDISINTSPAAYIPSTGLVQAAEIAYALKRPLLLSGEPGTGKTDFARYVAHNLSTMGFLPEPLIFNTKSSSSAQDLFYHYDAVAHFRSNSTTSENNSAENFIQLKALGLAFAHAIGKDGLLLSETITAKDTISGKPVGSVVLIDEIDKAPRDFPNDLLNEIEQYQFEIKEINKKISLNNDQKKNVLLILTSNFEKNLPEAFLRRCVYFHIEFPEPAVLKQIIIQRLGMPENQLENLERRVNEFFIIRNDSPVQKKPSTSEFLDFVRAVKEDGFLGEPLFDSNKKVIPGSRLLSYLPTLLKKKEDLQLFTT